MEIDKEKREYIIKRNSAISILTNLLMGVAKAVIGILSGSVAILSDGINNLSDLLSSFVTVLGYQIAKRKPTHSHPLGFGRVEYISALFVAFIVLYAGFEFLLASIEQIRKPSEVSVTPVMLLIVLSSIALKLFLWRLNTKNGKEIGSDALKLSGTDALSDVLSSSVTLLSALLSYFIPYSFDGIAGLVVSLFVLYTGFSSVLETVSAIVGERPEKATVERIRKIISGYPPLKGGYDIQIHSYGPTRQIGTCNVEVPSNATGEEIFDAMTEAQGAILSQLGIYFTFGMYAVNDANPTVRLMKNEVLKTLKSVSESVIGIHAFHVHLEDSRVHFDVVVDFNLENFAEFRSRATKRLETEFPSYSFQFNIDPDYS